ncbi:MAG: PIG-L family deacetylase [bacterium]|nr:PIG-L family deacetylase [bacterium]
MSLSLARSLVALLVSGAFLTSAIPAQNAEPEAGLVALQQAILDASTDAVVLNIAAHPDDEASRTRLILRRKHGVKVVTAYATYGDGGQNAIGREIGPELAFLRVRETLAAAAMSDVGVMWLGMEDFGFSKTLEETLEFWGKDRLRDAMRAVIDEVSPDLIVTNHNIERGHGHHRACAWAILEVLKERAARGDRVPPMFGRCGHEDAWVTVDPAELDPLRGETYARLAHDAWVQHVTQGPWGPHNPLRVTKEWWELVYPEGRKRTKADSWNAWLPKPRSRVLPVEARAMTAAKRQDVIDDLLLGAEEVTDHVVLAMQRVLLAQANVRVEVWLDSDTVPVGGEGIAKVVVHGHERVADVEVECQGRMGRPVNAPVRTRVFELPTPAVDPKAKPQPMPGKFSVTFAPEVDDEGQPKIGPEPSFVDVKVSFRLASSDGSCVVTKRLPYTTVPPVVVKLDRSVIMVPKGKVAERTFSASVRTYRNNEPETPVKLAMGPGIQATSAPGRLQLTRDHSEARLLVNATIDPAELTADAGVLVGFGDHSARVRVQSVDVSVPDGLRVGLVRGPDDSTERALADLGVEVDVLERDTLMTVPLENYSTLLIDIRANYHRKDLAEMRGRILEFCRAGGRVVVMYHKPREWNAAEADQSLAPFPFTVGRERVTEEDAVVKFLEPDHRLVTQPHRITARDFENWVQERGLNFPTRWDKAWTPLFEMQDSSEKKPSRGSLLYTEYGKGDYVYCSLAIYRQLRVGNAGAARLLVNLLAR